MAWRFDRNDVMNYYQADAGVSYDSVRAVNCVLPYPSLAACASGMVSRVSVYAVVYDGEPDVRSSTGTEASEVTSYNGDSAQADHSSSELFGLTANMTRIPPSSWPTDTVADRYRASSGETRVPLDVRLTLLVDETNPVVQPVFSFGNRVPTLPSGLWHGFDETSFGKDFKFRRYNHSVRIRCFVIVVDWAWEHPRP